MITSLGTFCQYAPRVVGDEQQSANQAGNANYNAAPQVQQSFVVNQPPAITSGNSTTFAPGKTGQTFTVNTTGFPTGASMSITDGGGWPSGVTLTNNSNGHATIAGTPAAHTQDTSPYHVNITASNGISPDAVQAFTLNIVCPAISISPTAEVDLIYNTAMTAALYTQSGGNGTVHWTSSGLPAGLSFVDGTGGNLGKGVLSGTPTETGTFNVTLTATDAGACVGTQVIVVSVGPNLIAQCYTGVGNAQVYNSGASTPVTPAVQVANSFLAGATPGDTNLTGVVCNSGGTMAAFDAVGNFLFTPSVSATSATCTINARSNTGATSTGPAIRAATMTFTLNNKVWYVNSSGSNGDGRSNTPFNSMTGADTASAANDYVFVHTGGATTTGTFSLAAGQTLWGQGATFTLGPLTITGAAANAPTLTGTVSSIGPSCTKYAFNLMLSGSLRRGRGRSRFEPVSKRGFRQRCAAGSDGDWRRVAGAASSWRGA